MIGEFDISFDGLLARVQELLQYDAQAPLIFNSGLFLFLFVGFTSIYLLLRRTTTLRILYVILFSIYFYYKSSGIYFLLLIFAAVSDYSSESKCTIPTRKSLQSP